MNETFVAADHDSQQRLETVETVELRLLARWLLHCDARTRQRGVLASPFSDAEPERLDRSHEHREPALA